jgi:hypothetical protein
MAPQGSGAVVERWRKKYVLKDDKKTIETCRKKKKKKTLPEKKRKRKRKSGGGKASPSPDNHTDGGRPHKEMDFLYLERMKEKLIYL